MEVSCSCRRAVVWYLRCAFRHLSFALILFAVSLLNQNYLDFQSSFSTSSELICAHLNFVRQSSTRGTFFMWGWGILHYACQIIERFDEVKLHDCLYFACFSLSHSFNLMKAGRKTCCWYGILTSKKSFPKRLHHSSHLHVARLVDIDGKTPYFISLENINFLSRISSPSWSQNKLSCLKFMYSFCICALAKWHFANLAAAIFFHIFYK